MKLLILTQKVDKSDPEFFFFYRWLEEFAKVFSFVTVICLFEGEHSLPENIKVLSLGKERKVSRLKYLYRFYSYISKERGNYDSVFVHMNPEYVVLGGLFWRLWNKKISLWYTHRQVNLKLRIAEKLSDIIFTASKEGFGLLSKKLKVLGHGIDTESLSNLSPVDFSQPLSVTHIGRITKIKHIETILSGMKELLDQGVETGYIHLVGKTINSEDQIYKKYLEEYVTKLGLSRGVLWDGVKPNSLGLNESSVTVNATPPGGMDKVVLESWAAERPAFTSNTAFKSLFQEWNEVFIFNFEDPKDLATKIISFLNRGDKKEIIAELSEKVREEYNISQLVSKIAKELL